MTRSNWKGSYLIAKSCFVNNSVFYNRGVPILDCNVGETVYIYNGFKKVKVVIEESMVGYKFGEFSMTRKIGRKIHNVGKKKKNVLKRKK
jgi:ribosomal protein S19